MAATVMTGWLGIMRCTFTGEAKPGREADEFFLFLQYEECRQRKNGKNALMVKPVQHPFAEMEFVPGFISLC
jgi:hypothetical protein